MIKIFLKKLTALFLAEAMIFTTGNLSSLTVYAKDAEYVAEVTVSDADSVTQDADVDAAYTEDDAASVSAETESDAEYGSEVTEEELLMSESSAAEDICQASVDSDGNDVIDGFFSGDEHNTTYYYRDSYFNQGACTYNASLSTMSMIMSIAAFGTYPYETASSDVQSLMYELGFRDFELTDSFTKAPETDSIGVIISHKIIKDENGEEAPLIAVAIRGNSYEAEWGGNTTLGSSGEAEGFAVARDQVIALLNDYLKKYSNDLNKSGDPKLWIMGFSRASAVANLTGNFLDCVAQECGSSTNLMQQTIGQFSSTFGAASRLKTGNIYCYGFEVPAGGHSSSIYQAKDTSNLFCLVDDTDLVPYVAPSVWGFYRYGTTLSTRGDGSVEDFSAQLIQVYSKEYENFMGEAQQVDDGFAIYTTKLQNFLANLVTFHGLAKSLVSKVWSIQPYKIADHNGHVPTNFAEYLQTFTDYLSSSGKSRDYYAENIQPTARSLASIFMGVDSSTRSAMIDSAIDEAGDYWEEHKASLVSLVAIAEAPIIDADNIATVWRYVDRLGWFVKYVTKLGQVVQAVGASEAREALKEHLVVILDNVYDGWSKNEKTAPYFTEEISSTLNAYETQTVDFVYDFVFNDLRYQDLQILATAVHYAGDFLAAHQPSQVLSWLRAADSNYTGTKQASISGMHTISIMATDGSDIDPSEYTFTIRDIEGNDLYTLKGEQIIRDEEGSFLVKSTKTADKKSVGDVSKYTQLNLQAVYNLLGSSGSTFIVAVQRNSDKEQKLDVTYRDWQTSNKWANVSTVLTGVPLVEGDELCFTIQDKAKKVICAEKYITIETRFAEVSRKADGSPDWTDGSFGAFSDQSIQCKASITVDDGATEDTLTDIVSGTKSKINAQAEKITLKVKENPYAQTDGENHNITRLYTGQGQALDSGQISALSGESNSYITDPDGGKRLMAEIRLGSMQECSRTEYILCAEGQSVESGLDVSTCLYDSTDREHPWQTASGAGTVTVTNQSDTILAENVEQTEGVSSDPGEVITVTAHVADGYRLAGWDLPENVEIKARDDGKASITFTMPSQDLTVRCLLRSAGECEVTFTGYATMTENGRLDYTGMYDGGVNPFHWNLVYTDYGYEDTDDVDKYGAVTKTYQLKEPDSSSYSEIARYLCFTARTDYEDAQGNRYQFDHWSVTCDDGSASELDQKLATTIDMQTGQVGDLYNPNGSTDPVVLLFASDLIQSKQSLVFTPVYKEAEYSYTLIQTALGTEESHTAAAGTELTVCGRLPDESTVWNTSWDITCTERVYTADQYGNYTVTAGQTRIMKDTDTTNPSTVAVQFNMPAEDVQLTLNAEAPNYKVEVLASGSAQGNQEWTSYGVPGEVVDGQDGFAIGDEVTIQLYGRNDDVEVDGWVASPSTNFNTKTDMTPIKDKSGCLIGYKFHVPNVYLYDNTFRLYPTYGKKASHKVTLNSNLDDQTQLTLYDDQDNLLTADDDGSYTIREGTSLCYIPSDVDGYELASLKVVPADETLETNEACRMDGSCDFTMPACDVELQLVYEQASDDESSTDPSDQPSADPTRERIDRVDATLNASLTAGKALPVSVSSSDARLDDKTAAIAWTRDGKEVSNPAPYYSELTAGFYLSAAAGYCFDDKSEVYLDGQACTVELKDDDLIYVSAGYETDKAQISYVLSSFSATVDEGATVDDMIDALPQTSVIVLGGQRVRTNIHWDANSLTENDLTSVDSCRQLTGSIELTEELLTSLGLTEDGVEYADGITGTVRAEIYTYINGTVAAPAISKEDPQPGSYDEAQEITLHAEDPDMQDIYYLLDTSGRSDITADEIKQANQLYTEAIRLEAEEGQRSSITVWAVAVQYADESGPSGSIEAGTTSEVASFRYIIDASKAAEYQLTVINGSGSGHFAAGETVYVSAIREKTYTKFTGFTAESDDEIILADASSRTTSFLMPAADVTITANYVVTRVDATVTRPEAGEEIPSQAQLTDDNAEVLDQYRGELEAIFYKDDTEVTGQAEPETDYSIAIPVTITKTEGYSFDKDTIACLNGEECMSILYDSDTIYLFDHYTSGKAHLHQYGDWTVTKQATTKAAGSRERICAACGDKQTEEIAQIASIRLSKTGFTYNGKLQQPAVTVQDVNGKTISADSYTVSYASKSIKPGSYRLTLTFKGAYSGSQTLSYQILPASQTLKIKVTSRTYKKAALKRSRKVFSIKATNTGSGKLTYKISKYYGKAKKYLSINKTSGKITVKKGTPKGSYKIKVKVSAGKNSCYKAARLTKTIRIRVK